MKKHSWEWIGLERRCRHCHLYVRPNEISPRREARLPNGKTWAPLLRLPACPRRPL